MSPEPGGIFFELKRRNVFKVGVLYVVIAWLLLQAADIILPALDIPEWSMRLVLVLLALGFPLAIFFAWAFELTPEGLKREKEIDRSESDTHRTGRKLDVIIICFLLVAVVLLVLDNYLLESDEPEEDYLVDTSEKSLAVLPFLNLSDDPNNEYFSDGLAEELLNVLVRVDGIRVASRTSSFQFKGQELGIPEIARKLKVNHIVEGSVRKAGNRIRVTAQLIEVADDRHLWSNSYERELEDIFAIQDEIAEKIVEALKLALGGDAARALAQSRRQTDDIEAFELYLEGKHLWRQRNTAALESSIEKLEQVVAIDPGFARGYAALAMAWAVLPAYSDEIDWVYGNSRADDYARRAIELDDSLADPYAVLGLVAENRLRWGNAEDMFRQAIRLQPDEASPRHWYAIALYRQGKVNAAQEQIFKAYELDPANGSITGWVGLIYLALDETEKAMDYFDRANKIGWQSTPPLLRLAHIRAGNFDDATNVYRSYMKAIGSGREAAYATEVMQAIESNDSNFSSELYENPGSIARSVFASFVDDLVLLRNFDQACELITTGPELRVTPIDIAWLPLGSDFRQADCFKDVVEHYQLVDHWRKRGWPEFCRPEGSSFTCQ